MDCSYVNKIIEKYSKNGQLTQNEKTVYSNLSQTLNNWFNRTYNRYSYYPSEGIFVLTKKVSRKPLSFVPEMSNNSEGKINYHEFLQTPRQRVW